MFVGAAEQFSERGVAREFGKLSLEACEFALIQQLAAGGPAADAWLSWVVSGGPMPVSAVALDVTWPPGVVPA